MKKQIFLTLFLIFNFTSIVIAENSTTLKQQILPIDCVYEIIDVGTQKLRYITPSTCPIDPGPPVLTEQVEQPKISVSVLPNSEFHRRAYTPSVQIKPPTSEQVSYQQKPTTQNKEVQGAVISLQNYIRQNIDSAIFIVVFFGTLFYFAKKHYERSRTSS